MYQWVEHTSELELEIEAATEPAVFLEALNAFVDTVKSYESAPDGAYCMQSTMCCSAFTDCVVVRRGV